MAEKKDIEAALQATEGNSKLVDELIEKGIDRIKATLPQHLTASRVIMLYKSMLTKDPKLSKCTPLSLVGAMMIGVELGLEPIGNQCSIIPYKNKYSGKLEANFQIGYGGVKDLFYRSDSAIAIDAHAVKEKDVFSIDYGNTDKPITHKPALTGDRGKTIGYYSLAKLKEGGVTCCYMTYDEVMKHAKEHSKSYDSKTGEFDGPWGANENSPDRDSMGNKTVMLKHSKFLPTSTTLQKAIAADEMTTEFNAAASSQLGTPAKPFTEEEKKKAEAVEVKPEPVPEAEEPKPETKKEEETKTDDNLDISAMEDSGQLKIAEMIGEVTEINVRHGTSTKTGKDFDISEYIVEDAKRKGMVQAWGKHEIKVGDFVKFKDIERSEFKGNMQFMAKTVEVVT